MGSATGDRDAGDGISTRGKDGKFDFKSPVVADNFDAHVSKSVPFYEYVQELVVGIGQWGLFDGCVYTDIGCSTGTTIRNIRDRYSEALPNMRAIGLDASEPMVRQAKAKTGQDIRVFDIRYQDFGYTADFVTSLYVLQFVPPNLKKACLRKIFNHLNEGGLFVLVEKVVPDEPTMFELMNGIYMDMKAANGYTPTEIMEKTRSLRGYMWPMTSKWLRDAVIETGFTFMEPFWQAPMFRGWIIKK